MAKQYHIGKTLRGWRVSGEKAIIAIPAGSTVDVLGARGELVTTVVWGAFEVYLFTQDLRRRADPIRPKTA